jgi:hypothetical protein
VIPREVVMGKYTIIADTSQKLIDMLVEGLVPEVISNAEEIGLRTPDDRQDVSLGLFLYDIRTSDEIYQSMPVVRNERLSKAPKYLSLFYMITAYSKGDVKYRMLQEEKILGRVIQLFHDRQIIPLGDVDPDMTSGTELHIQMQKLESDEKARIWSFPNVGNRLSLFYKVSPVAIDSGLSSKVTRVTDIDINVGIN